MTTITDVIDRRPNGEPITVLDRACETLRTGGFLNDAAARCGVNVSQMREWITLGNRAQADIVQGRRTNSELSDRERECVRFASALELAEADGKMLLLGLSQRIARGGAKVVTTTTTVVDGRPEVRDDDGRVIRHEVPPVRTVVERHEETQPDGAMIRWRLERRWPDQFGRSSRLELTGPEGGPVQFDIAPMEALLSFLDGVSAQRAAAHGAILAGGREVASGPPAVPAETPSSGPETPAEAPGAP